MSLATTLCRALTRQATGASAMCLCAQNKTRPVVRLVPFRGHRGMFAVEVYAAARRFVFIEGNPRREAARYSG